MSSSDLAPGLLIAPIESFAPLDIEQIATRWGCSVIAARTILRDHENRPPAIWLGSLQRWTLADIATFETLLRTDETPPSIMNRTAAARAARAAKLAETVDRRPTRK